MPPQVLLAGLRVPEDKGQSPKRTLQLKKGTQTKLLGPDIFGCPKDPAVLKILRRSNLLCAVNLLSHSDLLWRPPLHCHNFPGFAGIFPLDEGFTA